MEDSSKIYMIYIEVRETFVILEWHEFLNHFCCPCYLGVKPPSGGLGVEAPGGELVGHSLWMRDSGNWRGGRGGCWWVTRGQSLLVLNVFA